MKKILSILLSLLLTSSNIATVIAEDDIYIENFDECMDSLWLKNYDIEITNKIKDVYKEYVDKYVNIQITQVPDSYKAKIGLTGTLEEQEDKIRREMALDYDNGIKFYMMTTRKYLVDYTKNNKFYYLISNNLFWSIIAITGEGDQEFYCDLEYNNNFNNTVIGYDGLEFLKNRNNLKKILYENGINEILDLKIVFFNSRLSFLYIKSDTTEYLIRLHGSVSPVNGLSLPEIEMFKLYTATELVNILVNVDTAYKHEEMEIHKPTYETEALALQSAGLLYGNENGLDLLKPMTRIEAAAILMRAIGEDKAVTSNIQSFTDIPASHWGFNAAEKAHELGIVYGIGDNKFAPNESVTEEQFGAMVLRAAHSEDFNWEESVQLLEEKGIITAEEAETMDFFTRGDMAKIIYEARQHNMF